jgi:hypothetical protein
MRSITVIAVIAVIAVIGVIGGEIAPIPDFIWNRALHQVRCGVSPARGGLGRLGMTRFRNLAARFSETAGRRHALIWAKITSPSG